MDYGLKKWLQYLIYDQWNFNYFIAECVRKLSFLWWIKLEINVIFLGRGKEISNSEKVRLINHEWRWIFIFNCWSVVVPWPPQKDSKMGSKIFWSHIIHLYFTRIFFQSTTKGVQRVTRSSRKGRTRWSLQCSARAAQNI